MEAREGLAQAIRRVGASVRPVANGDTEDVVQEALARAIKSGVSLEAEQWLRTVAKRVAIDVHRRRRETPSGVPTDLERWAPSSDGDPEAAFIRSERSQAVREALDALPPRYRKALVAYAEEDTPADVATRLGLSATATWTLLSRARSRLRLQLEQVGFVPAMVTMARARWRGILATGAAATVAATAAVVPSVLPSKPAVPAQPKVTHVASAPVGSDKVGGPTSLLPELPKDVTSTVTKAVDDAASVPEGAQVSVCVGNANRQTSATIEFADNPKRLNIAAELVKMLPDRMTALGPRSCTDAIDERAPDAPAP